MRKASRSPRPKWPPSTYTATPSIRNGTTPSNHGHQPDPFIPARVLSVVLYSGGTRWHAPQRLLRTKSFLAPRSPKWRTKPTWGKVLSSIRSLGQQSFHRHVELA